MEDEKLFVDSTDLRGSTLVKVISIEKHETVMFGYYRNSSGYEGLLILPPGTEVSAAELSEIIRVLVVAYPDTSWKVWAKPESTPTDEVTTQEN